MTLSHDILTAYLQKSVRETCKHRSSFVVEVVSLFPSDEEKQIRFCPACDKRWATYIRVTESPE